MYGEEEEIERRRVFEEDGYDGIHFGGIKGIRSDAPESAKKAYAEWVKSHYDEDGNVIK